MNNGGGYYGGNRTNDGRVKHQTEYFAGLPSAGPSMPSYDPLSSTVSVTGVDVDNQRQQQLQQQHQHHQLFMAVQAASNYAQQIQQNQQHHQQQLLAAVACAAGAHGGSFARLSAQQNNLHEGHYGCHQVEQQQQHASRHQRQNSLDELLMLHPSLLSPTLDALPGFLGLQALPLPPAAVTSHATGNPPSPPNTAVLSSYSHKFDEPWLEEIQIDVPSISVDKMSGVAVVSRLSEKLDDVLTKYIPCVDFLVQCQQDLRKGIDASKSSRYSRAMSPRQFFTLYVDPLPQKFFVKNQYQMDQTALHDAFQALQSLRQEAKLAERQGCEAIKSNFLGGMKDGESWGLRKWLSTHGNALRVCTDLECILNSFQKLDRNCKNTKKLSDLLRPMAQGVLHRLQTDIPTSYQQHSTAHPYLPFFHRLEAALRGMSNFDPDDDDVICLDDDDDDDDGDDNGKIVEVEQQSIAPSVSNKTPSRKRTHAVDSDGDTDDDRFRKVQAKNSVANAKVPDSDHDDSSSSGESADEESVIEIIDVIKPSDSTNNDWICPVCSMVNASSSDNCLSCKEEQPIKYMQFADFDKFMGGSTSPSLESGFLQHDSDAEDEQSPNWPMPVEDPQNVVATARIIAKNLDHVADLFERNEQSSFRPRIIQRAGVWDGEMYGSALRLFADLLRRPEAPHFLDNVDEDKQIQRGSVPFSHIIKHPLSLRDIAVSILGDELDLQPKGGSGRLQDKGLFKWNMWVGSELFQALDLVFLNSLAYGNIAEKGRSQHRSLTNKIRKVLWQGITSIVASVESEQRRKQCMPTRRSEKSGFVVYKISHS